MLLITGLKGLTLRQIKRMEKTKMKCPKCEKEMEQIFDDDGLPIFGGQESWDCNTPDCEVDMVDVYLVKKSGRKLTVASKKLLLSRFNRMEKQK